MGLLIVKLERLQTVSETLTSFGGVLTPSVSKTLHSRSLNLRLLGRLLVLLGGDDLAFLSESMGDDPTVRSVVPLPKLLPAELLLKRLAS